MPDPLRCPTCGHPLTDFARAPRTNLADQQARQTDDPVMDLSHANLRNQQMTAPQARLNQTTSQTPALEQGPGKGTEGDGGGAG